MIKIQPEPGRGSMKIDGKPPVAGDMILTYMRKLGPCNLQVLDGGILQVNSCSRPAACQPISGHDPDAIRKMPRRMAHPPLFKTGINLHLW